MTPKQERFVEEYLIDLNATQAAIRAGYSEHTANEQAAQLLKHPEIVDAIDAAKSARSDRAEITSDRVLKEIASVAFLDPASLLLEVGGKENEGISVGEDGVIYGLRGPTDIRRLPENIRRAIVGWGWDRNQNFTVKLADKLRALDQLARHLSLYNDKMELKGVSGLADRLERAVTRADRDEVV